MSARPPIRVALVGHGWIGRAHAHALRTADQLGRLSRRVRLSVLVGRSPDRVAAAARHLGFERASTSWERTVEDAGVDVVAVAVPAESHARIAIAAAASGKHVLCEKPLAAESAEARAMLETAERAGISHACGFNYRFVPALRLVHALVASGKLGEPRHYRGLYLQDFAAGAAAGRAAGAVDDYSHLVDMLRWLVGEPCAVTARTSRFVSESEDAYVATVEVEGGVVATLDASRVALGWKGRHVVEINGSSGSAWWDMEDLNRLHVFLAEDAESGLEGFRDVLVTEPGHPFLDAWWTPGHVLGWDSTLVHQWHEFLEAVIDERPVGPHQASFDDGYRAAVVCDAIRASAAGGATVEVRPLDAVAT